MVDEDGAVVGLLVDGSHDPGELPLRVSTDWARLASMSVDRIIKDAQGNIITGAVILRAYEARCFPMADEDDGVINYIARKSAPSSPGTTLKYHGAKEGCRAAAVSPVL